MLDKCSPWSPATLKYKVMRAKAQPKGHKGELEPKGT